MSRSKLSTQSVAVIGAGIIGLSCALELANRGLRVTIYETNWPPRGASWAAAGMLAPAFEAVSMAGGSRDLYDLCAASAGLWPDWAKQIEKTSGLASGYHPGPSLAVALDEAEVRRLNAVETALADAVEPVEALTTRIAAIEPALSEKVLSGLVLPSDGQVDNRLTLDALIACVSRDPMICITANAAPLRLTARGLDHAGHDATILAAGWQTGGVRYSANGQDRDICDLDPALKLIEPVAGQMLSVDPIEGGPRMTIRAGHLYIVPKADRIVIGATSEPGRVIDTPEAEQIAALRARAIEICPVLENAPIQEAWAGIRPGLASHNPLIGETAMPGLFVASGHYRNGILLAPITAQIIADLIQTGSAGALGAKFAPAYAAPEQV